MYPRDHSPDYASTAPAEEPLSTPKKTGGVRKTIGDPNYAPEKKNSDIPEFDFGVTQSLTPGHSRPGTAAGRHSPLDRSTPSSPHTPNEIRKPHFDRISPGRLSPGQVSPIPSPQSRPSSRQMWQPGLTTGRQSPGGLTPEEFVQQRAAMARQPSGFVPRRTVSSSMAEEMMMSTQEKLQPKKLQKRNPSRPDSQGSALDFSTNLSAREQEHVARMTGSPLLNLPDRSQNPNPNIGLIGAISAREQDRRNMKEGISNHLVQTAMAQRQQQAQSAYVHQVQAQYRPGGNAWSQQQQYPQTQPGYYPQQAYQPQQFYQPPMQQNVYGQNQFSQGNQYYQEYYAPQGGYQRQ